ncbi:transcription antitermination factor NusB [Larsenimonas salina]|uniref:transcription antitermination factor NusB n=1 Tax=Larsenimonas salina TaxID=1295565 RepID=UPI002072A9CA|nr:transcription antitermination factor NusB [Larsenimonas salina]
MSQARSGKAPSKSQLARRAARELTVQCLYQWQLTDKPIRQLETEFRSQEPDEDMAPHENWAEVMKIADLALFHDLLHGAARFSDEVDQLLAPLLDRKLEELDQVELAILRLETYELAKRFEVPYRVVINEGVELAKSFGATDGHKFVNSILDRLALTLRSAEVQARRR